MITWHKRIRKAREDLAWLLKEEHQWTQVELAKAMGVAANHIALWERGERKGSAQSERTLRYIYELARRGVDPRKL